MREREERVSVSVSAHAHTCVPFCFYCAVLPIVASRGFIKRVLLLHFYFFQVRRCLFEGHQFRGIEIPGWSGAGSGILTWELGMSFVCFVEARADRSYVFVDLF